MIAVRRLVKAYGSARVVNELTVEIPRGQIVGLLGPNGAGKSTTLKMLTGMIRPDGGTATIDGHDVVVEHLAVKRVIGFVPESGAVFESLTGLEYLELVAALHGVPTGDVWNRLAPFAQFFELGRDTLDGKLLGAYSKGMRRKVVIIAALLHNPKVIFFDEPLDGLDANAAVSFKALITQLAHEGKTIVYSSHVLDVVERVCERVLILDRGTLIADGAPEALLAAHGAETLERLFTRLTGTEDLESRAGEFARKYFA